MTNAIQSTNPLARRMHAKSNETRTENDALTYKSTLNPVLDFFYLAPSRQGVDNTDLFIKAFEQDPILAMKAVFYIRDVRGGKQQKKTFQDILGWLYARERGIFEAVIGYVPEFGYWKEVVPYVENQKVRKLVAKQLNADVGASNPSLLAKWMPSENASSEQTKQLARQWMAALNMTPREYRKMLTHLRHRLDVVETKMSAQQWDAILYPRVPSKAMMNYRKAFEKHDSSRFTAFVERAVKGEEKIQSKTLYPHEIAAKLLHGPDDQTLEAMWNQLPNYFGDTERRVLAVVDTSGSMDGSNAGKSGYKAIDVAVALGLYCAERNVGPFQNMVITFSKNPTIHVVTGKTLRDRIRDVAQINNNNAENTDLQRTFQVILEMALQAEAKPEDMPTNILIISDMEFDSCTDGTNLQGAQKQYAQAGYDMPLLTFWNVDARNNQAPATKSEKGVFLVGGFSAETIGKVLNAQATNPLDLMLEILNSDRYSFIDNL